MAPICCMHLLCLSSNSFPRRFFSQECRSTSAPCFAEMIIMRGIHVEFGTYHLCPTPGGGGWVRTRDQKASQPGPQKSQPGRPTPPRGGVGSAPLKASQPPSPRGIIHDYPLARACGAFKKIRRLLPPPRGGGVRGLRPPREAQKASHPGVG